MDNIYKKHTRLKNEKQPAESAIERRVAIINLLKRKSVLEEKYPIIAVEIGTSERSLYRTLEELKEEGLIVIRKLDYWTGRRIEWRGGQNV